jgi:hypothetical protein
MRLPYSDLLFDYREEFRLQFASPSHGGEKAGSKAVYLDSRLVREFDFEYAVVT